ncbi:MAG: hypothetical protein H0V39_02570 [Nitrosomonas sp.]|nr:hypothetical protein [Nitrosomonas sp.]
MIAVLAYMQILSWNAVEMSAPKNAMYFIQSVTDDLLTWPGNTVVPELPLHGSRIGSGNDGDCCVVVIDHSNSEEDCNCKESNFSQLIRCFSWFFISKKR